MANKTALVTGASEGGIGAELVKAFAKRGYHVFAAVRTPAKAQSLASDNIEVCLPSYNIAVVSLNVKPQVISLDVTSAEAIKRCAVEVSEKTGGECAQRQ